MLTFIRPKYLLVGAAVASVVVGALILLALSVFDDPPHSPDDALIRNFREHRAQFEQLRNMMIQDKGLMRVGEKRTLPEDLQSIGIPASRIAEYRRLLKQLGIRGGIAASEDKEYIELTVSFRGFVTHNSQKGYVYAGEPVRTYLAPDLDQFSNKGVGVGRRPIEGNWYLFFEGY